MRDTIRAWDKGQQVNEFQVGRLCPDAREALGTYIHHHWRPRYERYRDDGRLHCEYLFPGRHWRERPEQPVSDRVLRRQLVDLMRRVGIAGPRAHPHALRKGFCTDLYRAGNRPEVVACVMHHRSPQVSLDHYDKRSAEELLNNLRLPQQWRKTMESGGAVAETGSSAGGSSAAEVCAALTEEMRINEVLMRQILLLRDCLSAEGLAEYDRRCAAVGIPSHPPLN